MQRKYFLTFLFVVFLWKIYSFIAGFNRLWKFKSENEFTAKFMQPDLICGLSLAAIIFQNIIKKFASYESNIVVLSFFALLLLLIDYSTVWEHVFFYGFPNFVLYPNALAVYIHSAIEAVCNLGTIIALWELR